MIGGFQSSIPGRVTFTKSQLELPEIKELVDLLIKISADGVLEYEELQSLTDWLNNHTHSEVPGVKFLIEVMLDISRAGDLAPDMIFEVQLAIERVLPKEFRERISEMRRTVYYSQPASENQRAVIVQITNQPSPVVTRAEASEMITRFNARPSATNRQLMFLRFWNRMDICQKSRGEVAAWMSQFIEEDPMRWFAWERFKLEYKDDGSQRDPSFVPIGCAEIYLAKVLKQYSIG